MKKIRLSVTVFVTLALGTTAPAGEVWLQHYKPYQQDRWSTEMLAHPVPVSLDTAAFTAAMERRAAERGDTLQGHGALLAMQLRTRYPDMSTAEAARFIRDSREAYQRSLTPGMTFDQKLERAKTIGEGYLTGVKVLTTGSISPDDAMKVWKAASEGNKALDEEKQRYKDAITLAAFQQVTGLRLQDAVDPQYNVYHLPGVAAQINERGRKDPALGALLDVAYEGLAKNADGRTRLRVDGSYEDTVRQVPALGDSFAIKQITEMARQGKITTGQMKAMLKKIAKRQEELVGLAVESAQRLKEAADKATSAEERAKIAEQRRQESQAFTEQVGLMRAELGFATTLLRGVDPQAARIAQLTGSHALDVYDAIHKFKAEDISSAVLTANLLNIASSLIGAIFGGPSDLQIILKELGEIRKDIHQLHHDMVRMFADVHVHLEQMTKHFDARFDALGQDLTGGLSKLKDSLETIDANVNRLSDRLAGVEQETRNYLKDGFFLRTQEAIDDSSSPDAIRSLSTEKAREYMSRFFTCAVTLSTRPLFNGGGLRIATGAGNVAARETAEVPLFSSLEPRLSDNEAIYQEVQTLAETFESQFQTRLIPRNAEGQVRRLPHQRLWEICTDAYLRIGAYHPNLLRLDFTRLQRLHAVGQGLKDTQRALALGSDRAAVASGLVRAYERIAQQLTEAIEKHRDEFNQDLKKIDEVPNPGHYNPWAGVEQPLHFEKNLAELVGNVGACPESDEGTRQGWGEFIFNANEAAYRNTIPKAFVMAAQMGLGTLQVCYMTVFPANHQPTGLRPGADMAHPSGYFRGWRNFRFGKLRLVVHVYFVPHVGPQRGTRQLMVSTEAVSTKEYAYEDLGWSAAGTRLVERNIGPIPGFNIPAQRVVDRDTPEPYTPPAPLPQEEPTLDAKQHFRGELGTLIVNLAKGSVVLDEKTIEPQIAARFAELREHFDQGVLEKVLKGRFDTYLQALSGARLAIRRWAELSQVLDGVRVLERLDALPDAASLKEKAYHLFVSPAAKETMLSFLQPKTQALRESAERALGFTTAEVWTVPAQGMLDRIALFAKAHGVPLP